MKIKSFLSIFIFIFVFALSSHAEMKILFPESNQTVAVSDIHVIGISDTDTKVVIQIDGRKYEKKLLPSFSKEGKINYMLMSILKLDQGDNEITIKQGDYTKEIKIQKVGSPVVIKDWTEKLSSFHSNESKKAICKKCHKFQNIKDCVNCHTDKLMGKWVHKPVKEGKCFKCHQKENNFQPIQPFSDTCLGCHKKLKKNIKASSYTHGPVAAGFCTICHSPHKSTSKIHLRNSTNELCKQCHLSNTMGYEYHQGSYINSHPVEGKIIEKTGEELNCASCHNPHYANDSMFLGVSEKNESKLCEKCHDKDETKNLLRKLSE